MADRHLIDVHLLLVRDDEVLLSRRRDHNPVFNRLWHLPSGKLDAGESALAAAAREAHEEVGVVVAQADLRHAHTLHAARSGVEPRLGLFFEARRWQGEPENREPEKCWELGWFRLDALPDDTLDYSVAGITAYLNRTPFAVYGWD
ncbi:ADP-ribose pyrophosphatase YjhB, NUDIX family [Lentzea fradiae]|uniref:ADP-ribose pyrophosphatase YjhB, NUDIX family n=1 Tax=Lentzea fradiae TaxID=200378 RepID=A0A1G7P5F8_9PSEU|nr:NUDIX domain-containing protein [Lentzea fradiae]SDF81357.1 ADP-ribose pyrophosphatase YjhB, NUDIX family [Lentzea fradiae]